ncbi:MAG: hypothetical protein ACYSSI_02145 [Planctomycetota bacterium]|jgi:hypothetical protein
MRFLKKSLITMPFLCLFCSISLAEEVENKNGNILDFTKKPSEYFSKLSLEKQSDLLRTIAESSYQILLKVPEIGLSDSNSSVDWIIEKRKWLEKTNDIVARFLALHLQYLVDSAVLNELYRSEMNRLKIPSQKKFKKLSFDNILISRFLKLNELDEKEYINFAINQETKVGKFCRKNKYKAEDFLDLKFFKNIDQAKITEKLVFIGKDREGKKIQHTEENYIGQRSCLLFMTLWNGVKVESRKELVKEFLNETLEAIDNYRDTRLLVRIYTKYGRFTNKAGDEKSIINSKTFEELIKLELGKKPEVRLLKAEVADLTYGDTLIDIIGSRVSNEFKPDFYARTVRIKLMPFMEKPKSFKYKRLDDFWGMWLELRN